MQTSVKSSMAKLHAGMLADLGNNDIVSHVNNSKQLVRIEVIQADNHTYTVTVNTTDFSYTSPASGSTADSIALELVNAINAGSEPVGATPVGGGTGQLYVESDSSTTEFTVSVNANLTTLTLVAYQQTIPFGRFVVQDDQGQDYCRLPYAAADVSGLSALGVAVHTHAIEQAANTANNTGYEFQSSISVLRKGRVYVDVETAVDPGDDVYIRHTVSGSTYLGAFRNDNDSGNATQVSSARFVSKAGAGETAIVEINLP